MTAFSFVHKNDRPWPNARLKRDVIIGHTTPTSTRLWLRSGEPGGFTAVLFDREDKEAKSRFGEIRREIVDASFDGFITARVDVDWRTDTTGVADISGLNPATKYRYAVWSHRESRFIIGHDRKRHFCTPSADKGDFSFGLMSCNMPFADNKVGLIKHAWLSRIPKVKNMDLWGIADEVFNRHKADFVIAGGDQVYSDGVESLNIVDYLNDKLPEMRGANGEFLPPSEEDMLSWYRDIYRGYWGFPAIRAIYSQFPTYMIWDDHEIMDGWGSHKIKSGEELNEILPDYEKHRICSHEARDLIERMKRAAFKCYHEYQHSHNPDMATTEGIYDYHFFHKDSAVYVLDGRGHRDIESSSYKVLGEEQFGRFRDFINDPETGKNAKFLFVVSAVPILHAKTIVGALEGGLAADIANLDDDLRDAWECKAHDKERRELLDLLFTAAGKGMRICILSGDVHVSAAFSMRRGNDVIYQLTSSPITYNVGRLLSVGLGLGTANSGESEDEYDYERLALYTSPSFSLIKVEKDRVLFQIYGKQELSPLSPEYWEKMAKKFSKKLLGGHSPGMSTHSISKIILCWSK